MANLLPDPAWSESAELCIGCGYSLRGLAAPGRCPECGVEFGKSQLILHGVPNRRAPISPGRRLLWVATITAWVLTSIFWGFLLIFSWLTLVICLLVAGSLMAWLLITGPRDRRGVERFVFSPGGIARVPLANAGAQNRLDTILIPWTGARDYHLRRCGPFWYRLRILPRGGRKPLFDAGIRCPDARAAEIGQVIRGYLQAPPSSPELSAAGTSEARH